MNLDSIPMNPTGVEPPADGSLYATMQGELDLMGFKLRVYQLSNGARVFNADDLKKFFGAELFNAGDLQ